MGSQVGEFDPNVGPCGTCGVRHRVGACPEPPSCDEARIARADATRARVEVAQLRKQIDEVLRQDLRRVAQLDELAEIVRSMQRSTEARNVEILRVLADVVAAAGRTTS